MTKHELVELTLNQLLEAFKSNPESFTYEDKDYTPNRMTSMPTIMWQPQVELKSELIVPDPNNEHRTVIVMMNEMGSEISCYIFSKTTLSIANMQGMSADAIVVSKQQLFFSLRSNYKKFNKLKQLIIARDKDKENDKFLRKLCSIFPTTLDHHILK